MNILTFRARETCLETYSSGGSDRSRKMGGVRNVEGSLGMGVLGVSLFGIYGAKSCFESEQSHKIEEQRHKQGQQKTGTERP